MKPKYFFITLAALVFLLAACAAPVQPVAPEDVPTAAPAGESAPASERITSVAELTAVPMQWISFSDPTQQYEIQDPAQYTVAFMTDGSVSVKADCNQAAGSYTADDSGSLNIQMRPMTMAACPEGSRSDEFLRLLGGAANFFENDNLYIDLFADSGTMVFAAADKAMPVASESAAAPAAAARSDAWMPIACEELDVDPALAAVAECGRVTVSENRAAGTSGTIQLAVVRVPSTAENPGAPLFLATGGPGGAGMAEAATGRAAAFLAEKGPILEDRDWVFFTQRGTQYAIPELNCPAYDSLPIEAASEQWSLEERGAKAKEVILACAAEFRAQGVDLGGYNTNENAADVKDIVKALGYEKIMLYGESYGTQLGQFVMRNHPEILEAVILDGVVPVTAQHYSDITDFPGAFRRVFAACEADAACNAAYPNLEQVLTEVMDELRANPVPFTLGQGAEQKSMMLDDMLAMNALFIQLFLPEGYAQLPEIIYQLQAGDTSGLNFSLPGFLSVNSSARIMNFAVNCSDLGMDSMEQIGLEGMPEVYARIDQEDGQQYVLVCSELGVPTLGPESDALIESDIPTLILQGAFDPATPTSGGDNVATGLPNSYMVLVPRGTHIQSHNPCVIGIMRAFMNDPQTAPDLSCIEPEAAFAYPGRVGYTDPASGATVSLEVASTYQAVGPGQWSNGDLLAIAAAYGPTKTVEALLAETVAALSLQEPEVVDGPMIGGLPSLTFQGEMAGNPIDVFLFGDENGTYRLILDVLKADRLEYLREVAFPALLETVMVGAE